MLSTWISFAVVSMSVAVDPRHPSERDFSTNGLGLELFEQGLVPTDFVLWWLGFVHFRVVLLELKGLLVSGHLLDSGRRYLYSLPSSWMKLESLEKEMEEMETLA